MRTSAKHLDAAESSFHSRTPRVGVVQGMGLPGVLPLSLEMVTDSDRRR